MLNLPAVSLGVGRRSREIALRPRRFFFKGRGREIDAAVIHDYRVENMVSQLSFLRAWEYAANPIAHCRRGMGAVIPLILYASAS